MNLSEKGVLLLGLPYQGQVFHQIEVRILTMGLECEVLEMIESLSLDDMPETKANTLRDLAYLSKQFSVIGVPDAALSPEYLLENLSTDDYQIIVDLIVALRKKRILAGESLNQG